VLGGANKEQVARIGIRNAPVAIHNDEKPRAGWAEILFLAERLGTGPSLIPEDPFNRAFMFGMAHEIAGENGLGWCRRLHIVNDPLEAGPTHPGYEFSRFFGANYGYEKGVAETATRRSGDILHRLSAQIERQQNAGKRYLVGDRLSAVDIYRAVFANLIEPLPHEQCPMDDDFRALHDGSPAEVRAAASPALLAHRDFVCETAVGLPFEF
jgi:glutathione S-transferase